MKEEVIDTVAKWEESSQDVEVSSASSQWWHPLTSITTGQYSDQDLIQPKVEENTHAVSKTEEVEGSTWIPPETFTSSWKLDPSILMLPEYFSQLDNDTLLDLIRAMNAVLAARGVGVAHDRDSNIDDLLLKNAKPATANNQTGPETTRFPETGLKKMKSEVNGPASSGRSSYRFSGLDIKLKISSNTVLKSEKDERHGILVQRTRERVIPKKETEGSLFPTFAIDTEKKFQPKAEAMQLSDLSIRSRIEEAGAAPFPIKVDGGILGHSFTRNQLSSLIGGNPQMVLCGVDWNKWGAIHGILLFVCPIREWNPDLPSDQGHPGIFLLADPDTEEQPIPHLDTPFPLFVKLNTRADSWTYMGQYSYIRVRPLSVEEFAGLPAVARTRRLQGYLDLWWGEALRKRLLSESNKKNLTVDDVEEAILQGKETIKVAVLNCVGYNEDFQRTLIKKSKLSKSALTSLHDDMRRKEEVKREQNEEEGEGEDTVGGTHIKREHVYDDEQDWGSKNSGPRRKRLRM